MQRFRELGARVQFPVSLPEVSKLKLEANGDQSSFEVVSCKCIRLPTAPSLTLIVQQVKTCFEEFFEGFGECPVKNLRELIEFNKSHAKQAMPERELPQVPGYASLETDTAAAHTDQAELIKASESSTTLHQAEQTFAHMKTVAGREGLDKAFVEHGLDVLVTPSDSAAIGHAAAAGYPMGVVPLGYLRSGQPQGLSFICKPWREATMVRIMALFESTFPGRRGPPLLDHDKTVS